MLLTTFMYLFLAAFGLSFGIWDLPLPHVGSLLGHAVFSVVVVHGLRWISLTQSGIKPISPALERGFLTTGPPRKTPKHKCFCFIHLLVSWDVETCHRLVNHLL